MTHKQFGSSPGVYVYTHEPDAISKRKGVDVNWSSVGSVDIDAAEEFLSNLDRAISYARMEDARIR